MIPIVFIIVIFLVVMSKNRIDDSPSHENDDMLSNKQFGASQNSCDTFDSFETTEVNPATGLLMYGGVDAMGNAYGMSSTFDDHHYSFSSDNFDCSISSFDDHCSSFHSHDSFDSSSF